MVACASTTTCGAFCQAVQHRVPGSGAHTDLSLVAVGNIGWDRVVLRAFHVQHPCASPTPRGDGDPPRRNLQVPQWMQRTVGMAVRARGGRPVGYFCRGLPAASRRKPIIGEPGSQPTDQWSGFGSMMMCGAAAASPAKASGADHGLTLMRVSPCSDYRDRGGVNVACFHDAAHRPLCT